MLLPVIVYSASGTWTAASSGVWTDNANWTGATYPGTATGDTAIFSAASSNALCTLSTAKSIRCLQMGTYTGAIVLNNVRLTVLAGATGLKMFDGGSELYTIKNISGGSLRFSINGNNYNDTIGNLKSEITGTGLTDVVTAAGAVSGWKFYINRIVSSGNVNIQTGTPSTTGGNFYFIGDTVRGATWTHVVVTPGIDTINYESTVFDFVTYDGTGTSTGSSYRNWQQAKINISGNVTMSTSATITGDKGTSIWTLDGAAAQTVTSNGKQYYDFTVNNTGTATVKFADSLSLLGDLTLTDGRDSLAKVRCIDYTNSSNDSIFHTDTTIITGAYYRNNAKVSRIGGIISFRNGTDGTINLVDAGKMGPFCIRKTGGKKVTALSAIRAFRVLDTIGVLKMGVYSLACTTLTVRDTGLQCAAVTLDTLNSYVGGTLGGGTITRWNWLANGLKYINTAATKLTVGSNSGFGGSAGSLDSVISATPGAMDTLSCPQDTPAYAYTRDQYMVNSRYLPATSVSGGNNRNVKTLSYTGVTKDVATGIVGTTVTFTGSGFVGACWIKFGSDSSALTVASYTSASIAVPAGLAPGVYAVTLGNGDLDQVSVGNFTVESGVTDTPVISSIAPIWQRRGATFKLRGTHFKSTQGAGTLYLGSSDLLTAATWSDTLVIDTIPASWTPKGTYNVIIKNSDSNRDTTQIRVLIPTIIPGTP